MQTRVTCLHLAQVAFFRINHAQPGLAHMHDLPVMQNARSVDLLTRHFNAVLGPQIADNEAFVATFEGGVLARNIIVWDDQITLLTTADFEYAAARGQCQFTT